MVHNDILHLCKKISNVGIAISFQVRQCHCRDIYLLFFSIYFPTFWILCGPAVNLRTLSLYQSIVTFNGSKFVISGPCSLILESASNRSHSMQFLQSVFTLVMCENICSTFAFLNGTTINNSNIISMFGQSCCIDQFVKIFGQMLVHLSL